MYGQKIKFLQAKGNESPVTKFPLWKAGTRRVICTHFAGGLLGPWFLSANWRGTVWLCCTATSISVQDYVLLFLLTKHVFTPWGKCLCPTVLHQEALLFWPHAAPYPRSLVADWSVEYLNARFFSLEWVQWGDRRKENGDLLCWL